MEAPDFEHGRVYFKQFGAERVKKMFVVVASKVICLRGRLQKGL